MVFKLRKLNRVAAWTTIAFLIASCSALGIAEGQPTQLAWNDGSRPNILWNANLNDRIVGRPVWGKNLIYLQTTEALYALEPLTGNQVWVNDVAGGAYRTPSMLLHSSGLAVPGNDECLHLLDPSDGKIQWTMCPEDSEIASNWSPQASSIMSIETTDDLLIATRHNWTVSAYSIGTGMIIWEHPIPNRMVVSVVRCSANLCLDSRDSIEIRSTDDGSVVSRIPLEPEVGPIASNENLIVTAHGSNRSQLSAISLISNEVIWTANLANVFTDGIENISISDDIIVASGNGIAGISSSSGETIWVFDTDLPLGNPYAWKDKILIKDHFERTYWINKAGGELENLLQPERLPLIPGSEWPAPAPSNDLLILPFSNGDVIAIQLDGNG